MDNHIVLEVLAQEDRKGCTRTEGLIISPLVDPNLTKYERLLRFCGLLLLNVDAPKQRERPVK